MENINLEPVLTFLTDLNTHNNKAWFEQNRAVYEVARSEFEHFTNRLIDEFRVSDDLGDLAAKDCISRIYRDIRFSKDKSPYKTNMWASIAPGGKRNMHHGYHVSIQPKDRSILAGGLYEPSTEQLTRFRNSIVDGAEEFKEIISEKGLVEYFGGIEGEKLKTAPQGFDKNHPEIELLKLKQIVVVRYFTDQQVMSGGFLDLVIAGCKLMRPFLDYFDRIV
jgi:uncharacterized protein (TIGR02453 family)